MENTLIINKNLRTITIPESIKNLGVESDDGVLRLHFSIPKTYGDIDLSAFNIRINYTNAAGEGDVYPVVDNTVNGDTITFSWLVSRFATKSKGSVKFNVCLRELDEAGDVAREFNTTPSTLPVLEGLETSGAVVQKKPDILESILLRLHALEQNGTGGDSGDVSTIIFTINQSEYEAAEGMTWQEWCSSEYNTDGYFVENETVYNADYEYITQDDGASWVSSVDQIVIFDYTTAA